MSARLKLVSLFIAILSLTGSPASAQSESGRWVFRVFLDTKEIGYHEFKVAGSEAYRQVEIDARFDVKILFINAYRYAHTNRETWSGGCLASIDAVTDDNGDEYLVSGFRASNGFIMQTGDGPTTLGTPCLRSFAYWDSSILDSDRLLNSQTGAVLDVEIVPAGAEVLEYGASRFNAQKYEIKMDDGTISLWYGASDGRWLALEAPAKGGRTIRYEPVILPGPLASADKLAMD